LADKDLGYLNSESKAMPEVRAAAFFMEINVTKQQITAGIQECAAKLGRVPTHNELAKLAGISRARGTRAIWDVHTSPAGMQSEKKGRWGKVEMEDLFRDWAGVVREVEQAANSFLSTKNSAATARCP